MAIIKCPQCGSNVSSQAYTCPQCNRKIKGHVRQCPKCAEWVSASDDMCSVCGNAMELSAPSREASHPDSPSMTSSPKPKKQQKKSGCLAIFLSLVAVSLAIVGIYFALNKYNERKLAEKKAVYEELARRIAEDQKANSQRLQQAQMDSALWAKTLKAKNITATEEYINTYPEGIFVNEAYMLLDELKRRKVTDREQSRIRSVVEEKLAEEKKRLLKNKEKDVLGLHLEIKDELSVTKRYINRDSFVYVVRGTILSTINRTDPKKPNQETHKMEITLDSNRKIIESSI